MLSDNRIDDNKNKQNKGMFMKRFATTQRRVVESTGSEFYFGYDMGPVEEVQQYIEKNYNQNQYKLYIGRGDDVMNAVDFTIDVSNDIELMDLIDGCEGEGSYDDPNL